LVSIDTQDTKHTLYRPNGSVKAARQSVSEANALFRQSESDERDWVEDRRT
jgi:hypothetical protein